jgi:hypothetical protein
LSRDGARREKAPRSMRGGSVVTSHRCERRGCASPCWAVQERPAMVGKFRPAEVRSGTAGRSWCGQVRPGPTSQCSAVEQRLCVVTPAGGRRGESGRSLPAKASIAQASLERRSRPGLARYCGVIQGEASAAAAVETWRDTERCCRLWGVQTRRSWLGLSSLALAEAGLGLARNGGAVVEWRREACTATDSSGGRGRAEQDSFGQGRIRFAEAVLAALGPAGNANASRLVGGALPGVAASFQKSGRMR